MLGIDVYRRRRRRPMVGAALMGLALVFALHDWTAARAPLGPQHGSSGARKAQTAPVEILRSASSGGAVTAVAWDGDMVFAAIGTTVFALKRDSGQTSVVARFDVLSSVESMSAAKGRVAVRLSDTTDGDIVVLHLAGDRLLRQSSITGPDAGAPFHGLNLTGDGIRLLTVSAGELTLWDVGGLVGTSLSSLPGGRGRPGSNGDSGVMGNATGGLTTVSFVGDALRRVGEVPGPDLDEVTLVRPSRALGIARGEPPTGQVVSYDLSDPAAPVESARMPLPAGAAFAAEGSRAISGQASTGSIQVYEAPGPLPLPRGVVTAHLPLAVAMAGESGLVGAAEGLYFVDAADPESPTLARGPELGAGIANAVAWRGDLAYVAHGAGLAVFSTATGELMPIGSAARPGPAGGLLPDLEHGGQSVVTEGGGAVYVASGASGIVTYDASLPAAPTVASQITAQSLGGRVRAVSKERWLYAATESGVAWLDISGPMIPSPVGMAALQGGATAVSAAPGWVLAVSGERLWASPTGATGPDAFVVHPEVERAQAIDADGNTAVALSGSKLYVLDLVAGAPYPPIARVIELPDPGLAVAYGSEEGAWVAMAGRLVRIDVGPAGLIVGEIETRNGAARALDVAGDDALAAMGSLGLFRAHSTEPIPKPRPVLYLPRTVTATRSSLR